MPALTTLAVVGIGLAVAGTATSVYAAAGSSSASQAIAGDQQKIAAQQQQQAELMYQRQKMEDIRQGQRARALALTNATSQGAGLGSGLEGGYGQISGQLNTNLLSLDQNRQIGQNIYGLNSDITQQKILQAQYGTIGAIGSGLSSLGGSLIQSLPAFGRVTATGGPTANGAGASYDSYNLNSIYGTV